MQRAERLAGLDGLMGGPGLGAGFLGIDEAETVELRIDLADARQRVVDEIDRRQLARANAPGHVGCRHVAEIEIGH